MKINNTFRTLIFMFYLMLITITVKSQGTTLTPMGQTVYLESNWDTPSQISAWESDAAYWIKVNNWDAVLIAPATSNYNCHSFAWNVAEGGSSSNAWLTQTYNGNPNLSKYWTNDAYTSTSTISDHEKIFYSSGDHSAVTTSTSGKVRSKWGAWPRYEHSTLQCPYNSGNLQYYKLVNPTISGAKEVLCNNSQETLSESSFTNISLNYDWSTSNPLSEVSGDGTSSYTVASTSQNGLGVIYLTITTPSGATATASKNVNVGGPVLPVISGPGSIHCGDQYSFSVPVQSSDAGTTYLWDSAVLEIEDDNLPKCKVSGYFNGNKSLSCTVTACGVSRTATKTVNVNSCGLLLFSPNPATDQTIVSIESGVTDNDIITSGWDMEVYDPGQVLKLKKDKLKNRSTNLNTSDWKEGIYIVRAKIGEEIISEKLVVKH